jgi:hypothetical protein
MADVLRGKTKALCGQAWAGYATHGVTAVLALFLFLKAVQ